MPEGVLEGREGEGGTEGGGALGGGTTAGVVGVGVGEDFFAALVEGSVGEGGECREACQQACRVRFYCVVVETRRVCVSGGF
jgi:hypothetical protein